MAGATYFTPESLRGLANTESASSGLAVAQRTQQHAAHQTEHRGVGSDSERQGQDHVTVSPFARARERAATFSSLRKDAMSSSMPLPLVGYRRVFGKFLAAVLFTNKGLLLSARSVYVRFRNSGVRNGTDEHRVWIWCCKQRCGEPILGYS
jgi:hypothetical protein